MSEEIQSRILEHLQSGRYRPVRPRRLARALDLHENEYGAFRQALRELMDEGRAITGARGAVLLPVQKSAGNEFIGSYRHNRRGFGFVVPTDPTSHEDLFIPPGNHAGALTGDIVRAVITSRGQRDGRSLYTGRITEIIERKNKRFVGTLEKHGGDWMVLPDGNTFTEAILAPDAGSRHIKTGTKVVVELTAFPDQGQRARGVITEVLGRAGEKDVDLRSVLVEFNLPEDFPDAVKDHARAAVDSFDPRSEVAERYDLSAETICTIDPDDAKDFDDAISLRQLDNGQWELGVHIADVSYFVAENSPLDVEARDRGNSTYFPGHVVPMLPEMLSNGVCSLQEGVPRLCKSAFITFDDDAEPIRAKFANTIIRSAHRLRYTEAQAIIDGERKIPHPDGPKNIDDYDAAVVKLLNDMNDLARGIQQRRKKAGQLVLDLPEVELVLDEEGKVTDAVPEDQSFTHTIIEMFMVEANEAVARLFDSIEAPFLRRVHPDPDDSDAERLRHFVQAAGHRFPKTLEREALQSLLEKVRGKPESFAINLAVLKSLTRAEYSPQPLGHFALASKHYGHFTSPIRRYADLTLHRLLDAYLEVRGDGRSKGGRRSRGGRKAKVVLEGVPEYDDLVTLGKHLSYTERRSQDAERELRQIKILELLESHVGDEFAGVVTGIANFGIFVQLQQYLIDGLIRYEDLLDDWWDVDEKTGSVRGQRTGDRIRIGDPVKAIVVRVDLPRRELDLAVTELPGRGGRSAARSSEKKPAKKKEAKAAAKSPKRGGGARGQRGGRKTTRRRGK